MAVRTPGDPGYDQFQWYNPADWFGLHSDTSRFKSDWENEQITQARLEKRIDQQRKKSKSSRRLRKARGRQEDRESRLMDEFGRYKKDTERKSRRDREYWEGKRDQAAEDWAGARSRISGDWRRSRQDIKDAYYDPIYAQDRAKSRSILDQVLNRWGGTFDETSAALESIRDQQIGLANELRDAPSTVAEQARIEADRALAADVAMAGAFGGSLSSNFGAFANRARTSRGDVLSRTAALRAQEYADRIGRRSNLLGAAGGTTQSLANLGISDVSIGRGLSEDIYSMMDKERSGEVNLLGSLAQRDSDLDKWLASQDYNILTGLGKGNVDVSTVLQGRSDNILNALGSALNFGQRGDFGILGRELELEENLYQRALAQRAYNEAKAAKRGGVAGAILGTVGTIGGAIIGGPAGAMIGGKIGAGAGNLLEGRTQQATPMLGGGLQDLFSKTPTGGGGKTPIPPVSEFGGFSGIFGKY